MKLLGSAVKLASKFSIKILWEAHALVLDVFKYMTMGSTRNKGKGELFFPVVADSGVGLLYFLQVKIQV